MKKPAGSGLDPKFAGLARAQHLVHKDGGATRKGDGNAARDDDEQRELQLLSGVGGRWCVGQSRRRAASSSL